MIHNGILQYDEESASYKCTCFSDEEFENDNEIIMLNPLTFVRKLSQQKKV